MSESAIPLLFDHRRCAACGRPATRTVICSIQVETHVSTGAAVSTCDEDREAAIHVALADALRAAEMLRGRG